MKYINLLLATASLLLLSGCGTREMIVLIPDPDGSVGEIMVTTQAGSQTMNRPFMAIEVRETDTVPSAPKTVDKDLLNETFASALGAQPAPPVAFILYFRTGTSQLTKGSALKIPEIMLAIRARQAGDIIIVGHTDTKGREEMNMRLSMQRAERVATIISTEGVDPVRIIVTYHGEKEPLVPTGNNIHEPRNRRVEVIVN